MTVPCAVIWPKDADKKGYVSNGIFIQQVPAWSADEVPPAPEGVPAPTLHRELPKPIFVTSGSLVSWAQG